MKISELMLDPKFDLDKYVDNLQKENKILKEMQCPFLGTGCKRELEQLKKQKDDVVEYIRENVYIDYYGISVFREKDSVDKLLRMLGEIDD